MASNEEFEQMCRECCDASDFHCKAEEKEKQCRDNFAVWEQRYESAKAELVAAAKATASAQELRDLTLKKMLDSR